MFLKHILDIFPFLKTQTKQKLFYNLSHAATIFKTYLNSFQSVVGFFKANH